MKKQMCVKKVNSSMEKQGFAHPGLLGLAPPIWETNSQI